MPAITVLMSVYNSERYLRDAIESILQQQYTDFEFLIIDDCSTDRSPEIIGSYSKDPRIIFIRNEVNRGLGVNLAKGVQHAKGEWIARMDADDIAMPQRLERQIRYAKEHPDIDIIGSWALDIDAQGKVLGEHHMPTSHAEIVKYIWTCPLIHPTVFIKKQRLLQIGSYGSEKRRQDYALWFRCAAGGLKFANIPEPLLYYRFTEEYYQKNHFKALLSQLWIGWQGCFRIQASPIAYIGVMVPLLKACVPAKYKPLLKKLLDKVDPRR